MPVSGRKAGGAIRRLCLLLVMAAAALRAADPDTASIIRFLEGRVHRDPEDITALNQLSGECLQRLRETGDPQWLAKSRTAAENSLRVLPALMNPGGVAALALAQQAGHFFREARAGAEELQKLRPGKEQGFVLRGDAALELNDLALAEQEYERARTAAGESLGLHVRLARLAWLTGDRNAAQTHYEAAVAFARLIEPPSPFWVAWSLVQRGANFFAHGDWVPAERDYAEALRLQPDAWFILDRVGELRAVQGRWDEAIAAYRKSVAQSPSPALKQALADVLIASGKPAEAADWLDQAEAGYLASTRAGEAIYFHHLAAFYADSKPNPVEAERWARKDLELRTTPASLDGLAWALYGQGKFPEAAEVSRQAIVAGARTGSDAHVLYHTGVILMRAGEIAAGRDALRLAYEINPAVGVFHIHR